MVRKLAPHLDAEAEVARLGKMEAEDQDGVVVMAGAIELLKSIPVDRWCRGHFRHSLSGYREAEACESPDAARDGYRGGRIQRGSPILSRIPHGSQVVGDDCG